MELRDKRIIEFLDKRILKYNLDKEKFLNPKIADLRNANLMFNMDKAVQKIKDAIKSNKKILIYGDYDSDGICSATILYLYFKSLGADVDVFIPNRFEHGYGISADAIEVIVNDYKADLIVTVDLGITAIEEVELLKQEGIDVVVTDHHIPLEEIPDCIVVDPKLDPDGKYGFDALCGAGVALKLVEAMSDRNTALQYLDICAIATVGDIVSLIDENRIIAKLGIAKINAGKTLPSIKFLLRKLDITKLVSTDISFKIVPRLNACGRMDNALKVFRFLIETNYAELEKKYAEMDSDNMLRLGVIEKGTKEINEKLHGYDRSEPSVLICGDFHEGVLGILASRICHELYKPTIIFTTDEYGMLKGSGRSIADVDIHQIISSLSHLLVNFGGHKMACGLTLEPENFDVFKQEFNKKILEVAKMSDFIIDDNSYDIELTEDDLTPEFLQQLNLLEPFGCDNEKPVLAIKEKKLYVAPINEKAFKHYKLTTPKNNQILCFNGYNVVDVCKNNSEKLIFLDISFSYFKGRQNYSVVSKAIKLLDPKFDDDENHKVLPALYNKYYSIFDFNKPEKYHLIDDVVGLIKQKFEEDFYGTIVVASTDEDLKILQDNGIDVKKYVSIYPLKSGQNIIVASPKQIYKLDDAEGYKNVIFMNRFFDEEHIYFTQKVNVYENSKQSKLPFEISKDRDIFARVYKLVRDFAGLKSNDVLEYAEKLAIKDNVLSASQILYAIIVFMELNFIEFDEALNSMTVLPSKKMELNSSKFFNQVG